CVEQRVTKRVPKYLGLSLSKPLLGYGLACKQSAYGQVPQAIVVVEGAIDFVIATQWQLPIWCVSLIGTHASRRQLAALLELQQQAGGAPILLGLDADDAGSQATKRLMEQITERGRLVGELPSMDGVKDIGDLGGRADGREVLGASIQDALALLKTTKGRSDRRQF
ncbi:MAG TPA: toprim domain-containing protein, partial [Ktedonobacteraceae bacterium]